jgi:hypothetical protein
MPDAIIRGKNGRRHDVDFGDAPVRVEIYSSEETVEIFIEADVETLPEGRRRFAILNIPRHQLAKPPVPQRDAPQHPRDPNAERLAQKARSSILDCKRLLSNPTPADSALATGTSLLAP